MNPNYQPERSSSATHEIQNLFQRKPLLERLAPIINEFLLSVAGGAERNGAAKPLPNYCYNIFKVLRKTYCKSLPDLERLTQGGPKGTDWDAWGKLIGIGLRCLSSRESNLNAIAGTEGLSMEDAAQLSAMICTMPWLTQKEDPWSNGAELVWEKFLAFNQSAHRCGLEIFAQFGGAIKKGMAGFLDADGKCVGESVRANIYWFLQLVWPESSRCKNAPSPARNSTNGCNRSPKTAWSAFRILTSFWTSATRFN